MRSFTIIWFGQFELSLLGTGMTNFAYRSISSRRQGHRAHDHRHLLLWLVLSSALGRALVDRWNRKTLIVVTDLSAGVVTLVWLFILLTAGDLQLWQIIWATSHRGVQCPAISAATRPCRY